MSRSLPRGDWAPVHCTRISTSAREWQLEDARGSLLTLLGFHRGGGAGSPVMSNDVTLRGGGAVKKMATVGELKEGTCVLA